MNTNYVYPSAEVGELRNALLYAIGPSSYAAAGDPVYNPGSGEYINFPSDCTSLSGNYKVRFIPLATGYNQVRAGGGVGGPSVSGWTAVWEYTGSQQGVASVQQLVAGSGMTPGTYPITFSGGTGSGAAGTVTVSATAVTAVAITNRGSYTVAPSAAIGGTPGGTAATLSVTLGASGGPVATGTNLSAEQIQFAALVSSL